MHRHARLGRKANPPSLVPERLGGSAWFSEGNAGGQKYASGRWHADMPLLRGRGFPFKVSVRWPSGFPAVGAHVSVLPGGRASRRRNRLVDLVRLTSGVTDLIGQVEMRWPVSNGPKQIQVYISVSTIDPFEVHWDVSEEQLLERPYMRSDGDPPAPSLFVSLRRGNQRQPLLFVDPEPRDVMQSDRRGAFVLADFDEYCDALHAGLPIAASALAGKVIEGSIRRRGEIDGWWKAEWEKKTLGQLLEEQVVQSQISQDFGTGFWEKVKGSPALRNAAVHQNWVITTMPEAAGASSVVLRFLNRWGKPGPTRKV